MLATRTKIVLARTMAAPILLTCRAHDPHSGRARGRCERHGPRGAPSHPGRSL